MQPAVVIQWPYLILVLSTYTRTLTLSIWWAYGAGTYNRDSPVCRRPTGTTPGYGAGYYSGLFNGSVLAVLSGKNTPGGLRCWRLSRSKRGNVMTEKQPKIIVVSEDAYKQNTVYRPWPEESTRNTAQTPEQGHPAVATQGR